LSLTSFFFSSRLMLERRITHPGFTSGCATYTLNLRPATHRVSSSITLLFWHAALLAPKLRPYQVQYRKCSNSELVEQCWTLQSMALFKTTPDWEGFWF